MLVIGTRHGETDWNARGLVQGWSDIPLNDNGRRQAASLAAKLAGRGCTLIVTSDLSRSWETGEIIADGTGATVVIDPAFRECGFGSLEGKTRAEWERLDPNPKNHPTWPDPLEADFSPFGGETGRQVHARQRAALDRIKTRHRGALLLVGHSRSLRTLLVPLGCWEAMRMGNCAVVEHEYV